MFTKSLLLFSAGISVMTFANASRQPNIVFILTDDLGYGDMGVFFQNDRASRGLPHHRTPQLDRMAKEGARFTSHYCPSPVSAPSRASLLSGVSQGHSNVRDNQFDKGIENNHTLGTVLRQAGYTTAAIGKWGLKGKGEAPDWDAHPERRGFDYFFGYGRHVDGHEHYPKEMLYFTPKKRERGSIQVWDSRRDVTQGLDKCYTTDLFTARAKKWIVDHNRRDPGKPFFIYLAFDTPHAVLELPTQAYPQGGGLNGGVQWMGNPGHMINTASGEIDSWVHPDYASATYDHDNNPKTAEIPWPDVYKRHATSVRRIDDAVGDLLQTLKDLGIERDTIVVFTSDNGPAAESYLSEPYTPEFFSSFGPFDGLKRDTLEGGLRVPAIALWPGKITPNTMVNKPVAMWDWMPTFAEAAGVPAPARSDGVSLLSVLEGRNELRERGGIYSEYYVKWKTPAYQSFEPFRRGRTRGQMQNIRSGDLVGVRYNIQSPDDDFEIYDVMRDPKETHNLAKDPAYAWAQAHFKALSVQLRRPDSDAPRPYDNALIPGVRPSMPTLTGIKWSLYEGDFPWLPDFATLDVSKEGTAPGPILDILPVGKAAGILYEGCLNIPVDGEYTFVLKTDTAAQLRIHYATVIDADFGYKSGESKSAKIMLKAGLHPFKLSYRNDGKIEPLLSLEWSGPRMEKQALSSSAFLRIVEDRSALQ